MSSKSFLDRLRRRKDKNDKNGGTPKSPTTPFSIRPKPSTSNADPDLGLVASPIASPTAEKNRDQAAKDYSIWDKAYDALNIEQPDLIVEYEGLLSMVLDRGRLIRLQCRSDADRVNTASTKTPPKPTGIDDTGKMTSQIPQDAAIRREKLLEITELGLKHMEDKKIRTTVLGHEIILQDVVASVAEAVGSAEDYIKDAIKDLPYASIVMAGVSLVLPLLKNPTAVEAANQEGFTYVTSQMRYYAAMEPLLLPESMKSVKDDLASRLVDLYKLIVDFQVRSIIRFYRSRTRNYVRGMINYDDWEQKLESIKKLDADVVAKLETAISASSLQELRTLAQEAETVRKALLVLVDIARNHLRFAEKMDRRMSDAENRSCLESLRATNPRHDKKRIEQEKGGLLRDSYSWVLQHDDFQQWRDDEESRLLWIKGDPGKGKTMLLCGIIDEMIKSTAHTANIAFFFCQATNVSINNATAVLRGLIYMLVKQRPQLMSYLRETYDDGKQRFEGLNAWVALSEILSKILADPNLNNTYIVVDALDECTADLNLLLNFIKESLTHTTVKWVVSSRNWSSIEKKLNQVQKVRLSLELNEQSVSAAVDTYVRFKVDMLTKTNEYSSETRHFVQRYLSSNAKGTFLWVALACQRLEDISGWEAEDMVKTFPPGLDAFYGRMMDQICLSEHAKLCKSILALAITTYRPITLDELPSFIDLPRQSQGNHKVMEEIIGRCGSLLILEEDTISFVHQSAKDFLVKEASHDIFPSGIEDVHHCIFSKSLQVMSRTLQRDIYGLGTPGFPIHQVQQPNPDPLAAARYSCVYWIDHLHACSTVKKTETDLKDGGLVGKFLRQHYLYWLEALSLLRCIPNAMLSMPRLVGLFKVGLIQIVPKDIANVA
jgi:hypothetical protein